MSREGNMQDNLIFKKIKALTLLEVLIAVFIFALVSASITLIFNSSLFVYRVSTDKNLTTQETQTALEWLVRDIQTAYAIVVAQADNIALINPQQQYIRYYLDTDQTIKRQECAGQSYLLAEGVTQFSLKYYGINNQILANPAQNILSLKAVEIDITTRRNNQEFRLNTVARFEYDQRYSWAKVFGGSNSDVFSSLQQTSDNGYILGGQTLSFGAGGNDFFLVKTDASGNIQWARTYGSSGYDYLYALQQTSDNGYILGGRSRSFGGAGNYEFLLIKTDDQGRVGAGASGTTWAKTYGGSDYDYLYSLQQTSDNGYILGGKTLSFGAGNYDFFLAKTDASGNLQWAKTYGGLGYDHLASLQQTSDSGYILGGYTLSFGAGLEDFLLIRTNASGNVGCCGIVRAVSPVVGNVSFTPQSPSPTVGTPSPTVGTPSPVVNDVTPTSTLVCPLPSS